MSFKLNQTTVKDWTLVTFNDVEDSPNQALWGIVQIDQSERFRPEDWVCTSAILEQPCSDIFLTRNSCYTVIGPGHEVTLSVSALIKLRAGQSPQDCMQEPIKKLLASGAAQIARGKFSAKSALDIADEVLNEHRKLERLKSRFTDIPEEEKNGELIDGEAFFQQLDEADSASFEAAIQQGLLDLKEGRVMPYRFGTELLADREEQDPETAALLQLIHVSERSGETLSLLEAFDGRKVIDRVQPWFKTEAEAVRWFLDERLPSLGELTAAEIIKLDGGKGLNELLAYIEAKELGGFE